MRFGTRRIRARLAETVKILDRVAAGDLAIPDSETQPDELGTMESVLEIAIRNMRASLESLHRSEMVLESAPVGLLHCDMAHIVTYANPKSLEILAQVERAAGIDVEQAEGESVAFLFGGDGAMRQVLDSDGGLPFHRVSPLGEEFLDVFVDIARDLEGQRSGTLVTFARVTEAEQNAVLLKEAMETERESADRLREAAERERQRADAGGLIATEMRLKADRISEVVVAVSDGDLTHRVGLIGDSPMD
ncbi:MAG: HAMP domain-containing protein [bacterium]|nr:HAMP domain-containing protein [bacterium]